MKAKITMSELEEILQREFPEAEGVIISQDEDEGFQDLNMFKERERIANRVLKICGNALKRLADR